MLRPERKQPLRFFAITALVALSVVAIAKDLVHDHDPGERSLAEHEHLKDLAPDTRHSDHTEQPDLLPITVEQHETCPGCLAMVRRLGAPGVGREVGNLPPRGVFGQRPSLPVQSALSIDSPTGRAPPA